VSRWRLLRPIALLAALATLTGLRAIDEAQVDFAVLTELNRIELYDYAELLVEQMEAKYPDRLDEVLVEKARTYYSSGKSKQAEATLDRIKPGSPSFHMALLLRAEVAALRGRNEDAAKAYAQFFESAKVPSPENRRAAEVYTRAVTVYSTVLKRLGRGAEAAKVLELLGKTAGASDRKLAFLKAQTVIDTEESRFNDRGPVQRAAIQEALKQLQELLFIRDGVAVSAYLETARGQILLAGDELNTLRQQNKGKDALKVTGFKQALDTVRMVDESDLLRDVEKEVTKGQGSSASPYAGALYFKAEAYRGMALAHYMAGKEDTSRKLARAAAKLLETVVTDYGESDYRTRALARHEKCSAFLEQAFGEKVALSDANTDAELAVKLEQAQALLLNRNYQGAIPLYLEALRLGRRSKRLPEVASRLIVCLGSTDRFLEAQAIGSYLAQVMPKAEGTPDCLFRLGGLMYEKAKALSGPAKEAMLRDAMEAWELFVEAAPDHPKAPEVCFAIAEHYYRLATDLAERSRQAPEAEREPLKAEARQGFLAAVPKYQRLVERYSSQDKGVRGLYKLGWIHHTAEQPDEAVDAFLRYCETETLAQHADDRLEAKFRAAEQLMLGETPAEAVEHYLELLSWLQPGNEKGFDPGTKAAVRLKEDAASYLAWAYDLAGEKLRPETSALREGLADCGRQRRAAEEDIRAAKDRVQTLAGDRERYQKEAKDLAQAQASVELDFAKLAQGEIAKRPEAQADPVRLATEMETRVKARVRADIETRQAEREAVTQERAAHEQRVAEAEARMAAATAADTAAAAAAKASGERLRGLRDAAAAAEKAIVEGEAASRQLEDQAQTLQEQREASGDAAAQEALEQQIKALAAQLAQTREKTAEAYKRREQTGGPEAEKQMADLEAATAAALADAREAADASASARQQRQLAALDGQILDARAEAVTKALAAATALGAALEQPAGAARTAAEPALRDQAQAAVTAFAKVDALQSQRFDLLAEIATGRTQVAESRIAQVAATVTELEGKLKPLQDALLDWKRKAQVAFEDFLKAYPRSKHVPRNLARLGGVFLELEQYDQAATVLNRLNTEFADSEAAQEAMFGLGRAQWEQGDHAKAAESFGKLLQKSAGVSAANLAYISERMLDKGDAAVSLKASQELLARSAKASDPEGARIRARAREPALFRAGQACLTLKAYDEAQKHFSVLLAEYPRTALFFEAKFGLAQARRNLVPPNLSGALADLGEVVQFTQDPVQVNRALCLVGELLAAQGDQRSLQQAVARFQQVVLLSDPKIEGNGPWIEMAIVESAKAFARLGNTGERDAMVSLYRQRYPKGSRAEEISSLPTGTAQPPAPAERRKP
jgi:TolA-binding protein